MKKKYKSADSLQQKAESLLNRSKDVACNVSTSNVPGKDVACNVSTSNVPGKDVACNVSSPVSLSEADALKLLHELQVHQIELEMQNEELLNAKIRAEEESRKYAELYDFAPSGYFSFTPNGEIVEVNLTGAQMLGKERSHLINKPFGVFTSNGTKLAFYKFLNQLFSGGTKESCEVTILSGTGEPLCLNLTGIRGGNEQICRITAVDVTKEHIEKEKLLQSEEKFRAVSEFSVSSICIINSAGKVIWVNDAMIKLVGYSKEQIYAAESFAGFLARESMEFVLNNFMKFVNRQVYEHHYQFYLLRSDGEKRLIEKYMSHYEDQNGDLSLIISMIDITDNIQQEKALRTSEQKYHSLFDQPSEGIFLHDLEGNILDVNAKACEQLGYSKDELLRLNVFDFHPENPDELPMSHDEILKTWQGWKPEERFVIQGKHQRKDGTIIQVKISTRKITYDDYTLILAVVQDITEQKKADEALQQTLEKLNAANLHLEERVARRTSEILRLSNLQKAILDNAGLAIITTDNEGIVTTFNTAAGKMLGYQADEIVGKQRPSLFYDMDEVKRVYCQITQKEDGAESEIAFTIYQHMSMKTTEWTFVRKDGSKLPVKISHNPIVHSDGTIAGFMGVIVDITHEKQALEALQQREAYLSAIIENQPGIVWLKDTESRFLATNEAFARSCGAQSKEHLVGKTDYDIWPDKLAKMYREDDMKVMKSGKHYKVEEPIHDQGETKWFETFKTPVFNELGEIIGTSGYAIDITERKKADAEIIHQAGLITSLLDSIPDIIFYKDLNGVYLGCNPQFAEVAGKTKYEIIGKTDYDLFDKDIADFFRHHDNKMLEEKIPQQNEEWITYPDGRKKLIDTLKTPYWRADGSLIGVLGISRDITERKKAEEEIMKAKTEAENANKAKSEFLSRMSHELRTPMNSILGFAQLLEMGSLDQMQKKGVKHILNSGKHLLALINEVLDISRIEAGRISLNFEPIRANDIIIEMMDIVSHSANQRQISLIMQSSPANNLFIKADRQRVKQVLLNLFNNAIKYNTNGGSVTVQTRKTHPDDKKSEMLTISITDTGHGISKENLSKIFVPFERIGAEKTITEGTGLGLSVVKRLMEAMNGGIRVESTQGVGSTFSIDFPMIISRDRNQDNNTGMSETTQQAVNKAGLILYIEDNLSNIELVEHIVYQHRPGIRLITSILGQKAISLSADINPDLILLDLNLPDVHGSEVLAMLQENKETKNIPVVIISADAMPNQIKLLMNAGAKDYLTKPLDVPVFLNVLDKWIPGVTS